MEAKEKIKEKRGEKMTTAIEKIDNEIGKWGQDFSLPELSEEELREALRDAETYFEHKYGKTGASDTIRCDVINAINRALEILENSKKER